MPEGMRGQCEAALPTPVNWRLPCVYPHNTKFSGHVTSETRPYKFSRAWGRGYNEIASTPGPTVNSGELRIPYPVPYPVPVCVTGNLWLVKFNGFILQLMAKTNHKFPDHANRNYYERDTEFEVLLNSLY